MVAVESIAYIIRVFERVARFEDFSYLNVILFHPSFFGNSSNHKYARLLSCKVSVT